MRYLLDSHIIFRAAVTPKELAQRHWEILQSPANIICVSVVSLWELVIKRSLGKIRFSDDVLADMVGSGYQLLPITLPDLLSYSKIVSSHPFHKDPFDRLLVAQAYAQNLTLISEDSEMKFYLDIISLVR